MISTTAKNNPTRRLLSCLAAIAGLFGPVLSAEGVSFYGFHGNLCIASPFVVSPSSSHASSCALLCAEDSRCQAFSTAEGPCQLFVFNKCSKSVRDCSCSRRGQVFVKQQPGLEPGALCPPGYGDDLCGVKYRILYGTGNWAMSRGSCQSESGQLVIMADVVDASEMEHVERLYNKSSVGHSLWLGGSQAAGSAEPAGGWSWVECNISLAGNSSLWSAENPSNTGGNENAIARYHPKPGLSDLKDSNNNARDVLCECVSPFD